MNESKSNKWSKQTFLGIGAVLLIIGSGMCAWILAAAGYDATLEVQSAAAVSAIRFDFTYMGAIFGVIILILVLLTNVEKYAPQLRKANALKDQAGKSDAQKCRQTDKQERIGNNYMEKEFGIDDYANLEGSLSFENAQGEGPFAVLLHIHGGGFAGGNLTAMLAMNIPNGEFIGEEGKEFDTDCNVHFAIDQFGPIDFRNMDDHARANSVSFADHDEASSAESSYMGGEINPNGCVNGYTAATAPVIFENNSAGYMQMPHVWLDGLRCYAHPYLKQGYVYVTCGNRGHESKDKDGNFSGKAPADPAIEITACCGKNSALTE